MERHFPACALLVFTGSCDSRSPDPTGAPGRGQSPLWWCQERTFRESISLAWGAASITASSWEEFPEILFLFQNQ